MSYIQAVTPNPNIPCKPGWCLQYVRQTFGLPAIHPTATAAWEASKTQHRDQNFPAGVWHAVWFSLANEPAGHVALRAPDGSVYSTSSLANTPYHHPNMAHLTGYYARYGMPLVYLGWTEDVQGIPVITSTGLASMGDINQEDELTPQQMQELKLFIQSDNEARHVVTREAVNDARDSVNFSTQKQVEAVGRVTQQLIIDNASADDIASAIPANLVQAVLDGLAKRLVK